MTGALEPYDAERAPPLAFFSHAIEPRLLEHLLEHPLEVAWARLEGFTVSEVAGVGVLSRSPREAVDGRLYLGLGAEDLRRIDAYGGVGEGLYRRVAVVVARIGDEDGTGGRENAYVHLPTSKLAPR
jgi:hypothetical protein